MMTSTETTGCYGARAVMTYRILIYSDMQSAPWGGSEVLWSRLISRFSETIPFGLTCYSSSQTREIRKQSPSISTCLVPEFLAGHHQTRVKRVLCKITRNRSLRIGNAISLLAQKRFVDRFKPDVVFVSLPWPLAGRGLRTILADPGVPYVCFLHSMAREYMASPPSRELIAFYRQAYRVFTTGQHSSQLLQEWLGIPLDNVLPMHNFVDCSVFHRPAESKPWPASGPRMVSVGRFSHEKGHDVLMGALASMKDMPWTLDMVGDGPLRAETLASVQKLGLQDRVRFLGQMDTGRIAEILRESDIFVLPSRIEGMPLSLLEAMASGLACVATDVGSIRELLIHNSSGMLVPPNNEKALQLALQWLVSNRQECVRLGPAAREAVVSQCDEGPFVAKILEVLQEAVALSSRQQPDAAIPASLSPVSNTE